MNILLTTREHLGFPTRIALILVLAFWLPGACSLKAQSDTTAREPVTESAIDVCKIDLRLPGQMKDILSNVLHRVALISNDRVDAFLLDAGKRFGTGEEMVRAASAHFGINETKLAAEVRRMKHVHCKHGPVMAEDGVIETIPDEENDDNAVVVLTDFARDVTLHVVLHEMGHALIREFDLPILANEETMADMFATWYLTTYLPERAPDVILARVKSLMIEAGEVPRDQWPVNGEHNSDARRAYQIAAIAVAIDRKRYRPAADAAGMSDSDIRSAADYGTEIHRSWRRIVRPLMMPAGQHSLEAGVESPTESDTPGYQSYESLISDLETAIGSFDWHSYVTIRFVQGDGGAAWSRSDRTIRVHSSYLRRFVQQGRQANLMSDDIASAADANTTNSGSAAAGRPPESTASLNPLGGS